MRTPGFNIGAPAAPSLGMWTRRHRTPQRPPLQPSRSSKFERPAAPSARESTSRRPTHERPSLLPNDTIEAGECKTVTIIISSSLLIAAAGAIAVCLQLYWFRSRTNVKDNARDRSMDDLLQMLWASSNTSLDPCDDFYWYACYNFKLRTSRSFINYMYAPAFIIQGLSQNQAGRAIFTYFASCISTQWRPENKIRNAVEALLEILNVDGGATSLRMFILIMKLNLMYSLHTDPIVYLNSNGAFPRDIDRELLPRPRGRRLYVITLPGNLCGLQLSSPTSTALYDTALRETAAGMKVNVTLLQLLEFSRYLCSISDDGTYTVTEVTAVLGSFIPEVPARLWQSVVHDMTEAKVIKYFIHTSHGALEHRFKALTNRILHPVPVVLLLTKAAVSLARENTAFRDWENRHYDFCAYLTGQLTPLWMLNHMLTFSATRVHNDVIMSLFDALVDTIEAEASTIPDIQNATVARQLLRELKLVLPYHVYPIDMPIPVFHTNFFSNVLYARQNGLTYDRYEAPAEIPPDLVEHVEDFYPGHFENFITVPMAMYMSLALRSKSSVQAVAIFGVTIADAIWSVVFRANTVHLTKNSTEYNRCNDQRDITTDNYSRVVMRWPRRAFASSIRALRTYGWYENTLYWGIWRTSLSQVFYHLVAVTFYCAENPIDAALTRGQLLGFLSRSADFIKTFGCNVNALDASCSEAYIDVRATDTRFNEAQ